MLLDVARGFVRDQAPIDSVRAQLETDTGFDAATWQAMVEMGQLIQARDKGRHRGVSEAVRRPAQIGLIADGSFDVDQHLLQGDNTLPGMG